MTYFKTAALTVLTSSVMMVSGCNSTDGFNTNNMSTPAKAATAGAVTGALIKSGGNSKDIAKGALAGAAIGGAGGYIYDETKKDD